MKYKKQSPESIRSMFDSIAKRYDCANGVMSLQMHKIWNKQLIREILIANQPKTYLDLCCGTGEIGFGYLNKTTTPCHAHLLDFSPEMLECAKNKERNLSSNQHTIEYIEADAQEIPLPESSIDCATMAYGIRNVKDPQKCVTDVCRVLNNGGSFGILELTRPNNGLIRFGHQIYLRTVLPLVGKLVSSNQEAYEYLCGSIDQFIDPVDLVSVLKKAGFRRAESRSLFGGIATLFIAQK